MKKNWKKVLNFGIPFILVMFAVYYAGIDALRRVQARSTAVAAKGNSTLFDSGETPKVITVGDSSFLPLNLPGEAGENAEAVLKAVEEFKATHADFQVIHWNVQVRSPRGQADTAVVEGVWIDHGALSEEDIRVPAPENPKIVE